MLTKSHFSSKNANSTLVSTKTFISSQATIAKSKLNYSLPLITVYTARAQAFAKWARSSAWQSDWLLTSLSRVQSPLFLFERKSRRAKRNSIVFLWRGAIAPFSRGSSNASKGAAGRKSCERFAKERGKAVKVPPGPLYIFSSVSTLISEKLLMTKSAFFSYFLGLVVVMPITFIPAFLAA